MFSKKLKQYRLVNNIPQYIMGKKLGNISQTTIWRLEHNIPVTDVIYDIAYKNFIELDTITPAIISATKELKEVIKDEEVLKKTMIIFSKLLREMIIKDDIEHIPEQKDATNQ